jgi:hypothetical protein
MPLLFEDAVDTFGGSYPSCEALAIYIFRLIPLIVSEA